LYLKRCFDKSSLVGYYNREVYVEGICGGATVDYFLRGGGGGGSGGARRWRSGKSVVVLGV